MRKKNLIVEVTNEKEFLEVLNYFIYSFPKLNYTSHSKSYKEFSSSSGIYYVGVHNNIGWYNSTCSYSYIPYTEFLKEMESECIIFN